MKNNLEILKQFVSTASAKHPEKLTALLSITEKHYTENRSMVDAVMGAAPEDRRGACGFSILKTNVPAFVSEMLALR